MRTMEYINRKVLEEITTNEKNIEKGIGTSKSYDKRIVIPEDAAMDAAVELSL